MEHVHFLFVDMTNDRLYCVKWECLFVLTVCKCSDLIWQLPTDIKFMQKLPISEFLIIQLVYNNSKHV
jgi:hypothetical protein